MRIQAPFGVSVKLCSKCADMLPSEFFLRYPWAGSNFIHYARAVHRALKRQARRAVSLAFGAYLGYKIGFVDGLFTSPILTR